MTLPDLPRTLNKREAKITPKIIRWFEMNYPNSCALEIKVKGNKLLPHQSIALTVVQNGSFSYKIPDMGHRSPFDAFVLKRADAFVVTYDDGICTAVSPNGKSFRFSLSSGASKLRS